MVLLMATRMEDSSKISRSSHRCADGHGLRGAPAVGGPRPRFAYLRYVKAGGPRRGGRPGLEFDMECVGIGEKGHFHNAKSRSKKTFWIVSPSASGTTRRKRLSISGIWPQRRMRPSAWNLFPQRLLDGPLDPASASLIPRSPRLLERLRLLVTDEQRVVCRAVDDVA